MLEAVPVAGSFVPGVDLHHLSGSSAVIATGSRKLPAVLASCLRRCGDQGRRLPSDGTSAAKRDPAELAAVDHYPGVIARAAKTSFNATAPWRCSGGSGCAFQKAVPSRLRPGYCRRASSCQQFRSGSFQSTSSRLRSGRQFTFVPGTAGGVGVTAAPGTELHHHWLRLP